MARNALGNMRRALGLNALDLHSWDGQPRPQIIARDELQARWDGFCTETKEKGQLVRQKMTLSARIAEHEVPGSQVTW
jgi:hypothetical protein